MQRKLSRRSFLQTSSSAAMGMMPLLSGGVTPGIVRTMWGEPYLRSQDEYRAVICLFWAGGNDCHNTIVCLDDAEYQKYSIVKGPTALSKSSLLPIGRDKNGRELGIHPSLVNIQKLLTEGSCASILNVGNLVAPVTKQQIFDQSVPLPPYLQSHVDQGNQAVSLLDGNELSSGGGGRMIDFFQDLNGTPELTSIYTNQYFQLEVFSLGQKVNAVPMFSLTSGLYSSSIDNWMDQIYNFNYSNIPQRTYASIMKDAAAIGKKVKESIDAAPSLGVTFPDSSLGQQLEIVSKLMSIRDVTKMKRQVFLCTIDGFDAHSDLLLYQKRDLDQIDGAIGPFVQALKNLNLYDNVVLYTCSDFGRTKCNDNNGSDHGWGGHYFMLGGAVASGNYGAFPDLALNSKDDLGTSILIPTLSNSQYFNTIAEWFGTTESQQGIVTPMLKNFETKNLGFMKS